MKRIISILLLFTATLSQAQTYLVTSVNGTGANSSGNVTISAGADSATFATKNYVNSLNAQWTVSRTSDSSNFLFTNGSATSQISDNGWVLLSTATASNVASVEFTGLSSTYKEYMILCNDVYPGTNNASLYMQVGTGAGPTYQTGATDYNGQFTYPYVPNNTTSHNTGQESYYGTFAKVTRLMSNSSSWLANGFIYLHNPSQSTSWHTFRQAFTYFEQGAYLLDLHGAGAYTGTTPVTAVKLYFSSGNIYGSFKLYGLK